jgi:hypothetical protein
VLATVPALATVAWFYQLWGGLTPPKFQGQHASWNPATPAFTLSLFAIYSLLFVGWLWPGLVRLWAQRRTGGWLVIVLCVLVGLIAAALPVTNYLYEPRATGLWNVVRLMEDRGLTLGRTPPQVPFVPTKADEVPPRPQFGHTSPLLLALTPLGLIALAAWLAQLPRRRAWLYFLTLAGFLAAQTANANAWQRYLEPFLLILMALMAADIAVTEDAPPRLPRWLGGPGPRARWVGPLVLGVLGAGLTAFTLWNDPIFVQDWPSDPLGIPLPPPPVVVR